MAGGRGYASGRNAVAICDRCAKKIPYRELQYDGQVPELSVCPDCWDPKHPQEYLPDTFDPITLYDPTGDPDKAVAGGWVTISSPWIFSDQPDYIFGIGVGIASAVYAPSSGLVVGDAFDQNSFDTVSFSQDAFDL